MARIKSTKTKKAVAATSTVTGEKKKKVHKRFQSKAQNFSRYIHRTLMQVHPDNRISAKAMDVLNCFVRDMFERIASEAARLCKYNKKPTLQAREIQTAVRLLFPGELAKHAVSEGTKAVAKFGDSKLA